MQKMILRRLSLLVPLVFAISAICFVLINLSPSDPAEVALRVNDITPTSEAIEQMRVELGLDKPMVERYFIWIKGVLQGDFGVSYETNTPIIEEILYAFPTTLKLALSALLLIVSLGLFFGVLCAKYEGSLLDKTIRGFIFFATAMPSFWLGLLLIWFFSLRLDIFPTGGLEEVKGIVLPAITLSLAYVATYIRLMRNTLLSNQQMLFILYAKARGLKEITVLKHQIRNALVPFVTALGMSIPKLVAGTVVVENIFSLPGLGRLCIHAIFSRDYPMIQAYILLMAVSFILFNLFADILVHWINPRLKEQL
ncbi:MAG TPA: nickel ABC transporter permease subunit NikB [Sulfurospirillum sp. UBA11407]|nr:MAG TPA: nickel ABC transporter permease subunit NikB [Sulfurospirillum sp. UBA11407]